MQSSEHNRDSGDAPEKEDYVVTLMLNLIGSRKLPVMSVRLFLEELQERRSTMKVGRANQRVSVLDKRK